jgi:serine/threonine protein kinase
MVLEFADGGTLCEYLAQHFDNLIWKDKYKLGLDIANGLKYLHALDIVHKDLVRSFTLYRKLYIIQDECMLITISTFHIVF